MSDTSDQAELDLGATEDVETAPAETTTESAAEQAPERHYLEVDDPDNTFVRQTINGQEVEVPYSEWSQGYSRHADYTQKSQSLADQRRELEYARSLQQALDANPGLTVQALAQNAGMSVEQYLGFSPQQQQAAAELEYTDPLERQIAEQQQQMNTLQQQLEQQRADAMLERAVGDLKQQFNIGDEEVREVVQTAMQMGLGPQAFPMIYQATAFQKVQAQTAAQQEATQRQEQQRAARTAAAEQATAQIDTSGTGSAASIGGDAELPSNMSPREAVMAALDGVTDIIS